MSWVRRAYGCDCGCYDCPTCHPELQELVLCDCCGKHVHRYDMTDNRCGQCEDAGMVQCEDCGRWFADASRDWNEEAIILCAVCMRTTPTTTPSPAGNPGNFPQLCEVAQ